ncbi:LINE-1 retrotransposable element ORF2 protein [Bienertia sinuspersici]
MDPQWNSTTITLIPKIPNPQMVKDFRPISCCTVLYKIISKILTARIAQVIGEVIDDAQAGFIPGKHIGDNILLATELMKGYGQKFISPRCMLKIDLKKAYDSVEWGFLETILNELGFPNQFVKWVIGCITSVNYSVMVNGAPYKPFKGEKGLRQGDPMSPFIFAIGMEYLSRCMQELSDEPDFNFHPRCEKIQLTHMMFADDLLMLARADVTSVQILLEAFFKFSKASGLLANLEKSEVYFGGVSEAQQDNMLGILGMPKGSIPFTYLGAPLSSKKLTIAQCKPLVERVTARIHTWVARHLSYAGRLQTIKSVLFGIQTYWSQIFILPKKIVKEIESKFRTFLWTGTNDNSRKAPISWAQVCLPKSCGGWNILSLYDWNKAAVSRILWDLSHKADSMWVRWMHTYYFKQGKLDWWNNLNPKNCSWALKKVLSCREVVNQVGGWAGLEKQGKFSIHKMYKAIRPQAPKIPWRRVICNNHASPKSVFVLWMAVQNRLTTKDRLIQWNINCDPQCMLCENDDKSLHHLFFKCEYNADAWSRVMNALKGNSTTTNLRK